MNVARLLASVLVVSASMSASATQGIQATSSAALANNRALFVERESQLKTAPYEATAGLLASLQDYPLYPYLQFQVYERFPERLTQAEVSRFLDAYPLFPKRSQLQQLWLKQLASQNRWPEWVAAYERLPLTSALAQCDLGKAYLQTGKQAQAMTLAAELWTVGKSQPNQCDPLFEAWTTAGHLTPAVAAARYWLAIEANEMRLARYLHSMLSPDALRLANAYEALMDKPADVPTASLGAFPEAARTLLIRKAFQSLTKQNLETAAERWLAFRALLPKESPLQAELDVYIGRRLAFADTPSATALLARLDPEFRHAGITEALLVEALSVQNIQWLQVQKLISRLPEAQQSSDRWRYWYARAGESLTPGSDVVEEIWNQVAGSRSFYGFLAAEHLRKPFNLNDQPPQVNQTVLAALQNTPAVRRAEEWLQLDRRVEATREWNSVRAKVNAEQRAHMATLALHLGWYHQAIMDAVHQEQWNYLDVRFPLIYTEVFGREAGRNNIDQLWAIAIARQESAFKPEAVSSVGARGLMQLMPATATATSKKYGLPLPQVSELSDPATNIALGTAYLSEMYNRFGQSRALASAAYNAGPSRVNSWLKERGHLPLDAWIETIPFAETRNYVQNVLAFRVIYGQRSGHATTMLSAAEQPLMSAPVQPPVAVTVQ